ncbi:hypothetical protein AGMMS49991_05900 [Spirochaetia bacterium]|nr:hypothetical protein AGMMS49991_05900 [Spirochaetia bacterium]
MDTNKKPNLLFDASVITNIFCKDHNRSGIFFVAYNILRELGRRETFNISLYVTQDNSKFIRKMKREPFLFGFSIITLPEKEIFLFNISVHKQKMRETRNVFVKTFKFLQIIKNYILFFLFLLSFQDARNNRKLNNIDIFFSPNRAIPGRVKNHHSIKRFIVLHDTIPVLDRFIDTGAEWFVKIIQSLDTETHCFCVSENTKKDFLKALDSQIDERKMTVSSIATAQQFFPNYDKDALQAMLQKYGVSYNPNNAYIFSLCSIDPRKNLLFTIVCFVKFVQKHQIQNLYFYLGGGHFETFIAQFEKKLADFSEYRDKIVRLGYIDDEDVNILYSNSLFFTYLSQYEGFGMPPLEAMQAGTPVITSNNSSLPEVVGDAAITIDYDSEEQCIKAFEDLYFNEDLRKHYIAKGLERAKLFSWDKTVDKMTKAIMGVLGKTQHE